MADWCPNCRQDTLEDTGILSDIPEYYIWRCSQENYEVKRKKDRTASIDPKYTRIMGVGDDRA